MFPVERFLCCRHSPAGGAAAWQINPGREQNEPHRFRSPGLGAQGQSRESPLEGAGTQGEKMNDLCSGSVQSGRGRMQRKRTRARDRLQEITAVSPKSNIKATTGLTGAADQMEHRSEVRVEVCIPRSFTAGGNGPDQAKLNSLKLAKVSGRSRYSI